MASYSTVLGKWSKLNSALPGFKSPPHVSCVDSLYFFLLRSSLLYGKAVEVNWIHRMWSMWQGDWEQATAGNCCHLSCPHRNHNLLLANKSHTAEWPQSLPSGSSAEEWSRTYLYIYLILEKLLLGNKWLTSLSPFRQAAMRCQVRISPLFLSFSLQTQRRPMTA